MHTYAHVLPGQVFIDTGTLLQIGWIPVVWGLVLFCQILHDGNAVEMIVPFSHWNALPRHCIRIITKIRMRICLATPGITKDLSYYIASSDKMVDLNSMLSFQPFSQAEVSISDCRSFPDHVDLPKLFSILLSWNVVNDRDTWQTYSCNKPPTPSVLYKPLGTPSWY